MSSAERLSRLSSLFDGRESRDFMNVERRSQRSGPERADMKEGKQLFSRMGRVIDWKQLGRQHMQDKSKLG
jgi:hypothetical protein